LSDLAKVDYLDRVNRAIDHITRHLADPLALDDVAGVAHFSPWHFHRIFKAIVGETLHDFVTRVRLERALFLVSRHPRRSLTDIALACGLGSSSDFSRTFRQRFGVPPRRFDVAQYRRDGRRAITGLDPDGNRLAHLPPGANPDGFTARVRQLPARRVAYLRVFRPYQGGAQAAAEQLVAWARERGLDDGPWLGYQWDDPEIVPLDRCRYDIGVEVPETAVIDAAATEIRFPPMVVAEVDVAGPIELELRALDWLYTTWLPHSGFAPGHQPCFESWQGRPFAHGTAHFELRLQLAIVDGATPL
jgi:AraC family transcriptional regulator